MKIMFITAMTASPPHALRRNKDSGLEIVLLMRAINRLARVPATLEFLIGSSKPSNPVMSRAAPPKCLGLPRLIGGESRNPGNTSDPNADSGKVPVVGQKAEHLPTAQLIR